MQMEIEVANNLLKSIDGREERTFAYPCSNPVLGKIGWAKSLLRAAGLEQTRLPSWLDRLNLDLGATRHNYSGLLQGRCVAARGGTPRPWPAEFDRYCVPAVGGDGLREPELLAELERAITGRFWGVFMFHGVGDGHCLFVERTGFESFVQRLATDSRVCVKTFLDGARELWPLEADCNRLAASRVPAERSAAGNLAR
jgi:hypothetical protein